MQWKEHRALQRVHRKSLLRAQLHLQVEAPVAEVQAAVPVAEVNLAEAVLAAAVPVAEVHLVEAAPAAENLLAVKVQNNV